MPGNLTAVAVSATRVDLGWDASTDNVGVTGYTITRNGSPLTTVGGTVTTFSGHDGESEHDVHVFGARDRCRGNVSGDVELGVGDDAVGWWWFDVHVRADG